ncbi:MAG: hypothetical protein ACKO9V_03170, partial [Candidatus Kapaibacterium sp.]
MHTSSISRSPRRHGGLHRINALLPLVMLLCNTLLLHAQGSAPASARIQNTGKPVKRDTTAYKTTDVTVTATRAEAITS